jgi:KDO2-lipid IV(A) lauroyltransferase
VRDDIAGQLVGMAYRAGWAGIRAMPEPVAAKAFRTAADVAFRRRGPGVIQLARNLLRVLGPGATPAELSAVVQAGLRSYARYWMETFRLERMDPEEVSRRALATSVGLEHIKRGMDSGRGVILALPHSGNWDVAGVSMVHLYGGFTTVVERLTPESLYRRFVSFREAIGFEVLPLGSPTLSGVLRDRLRAGRMICLLADRDLSGSGVPVTLFGEPTTMPGGPAMLAALTGADLLPVHLSFTDGGWRQHIDPPVILPDGRLAERVRAGTQALADAFTRDIALFPADWHMLQPLWTADRPAPSAPAGRSR